MPSGFFRQKLEENFKTEQVSIGVKLFIFRSSLQSFTKYLRHTVVFM